MLFRANINALGSLVDVVMNVPEVQASSRLEATDPLGDAESLRERAEDSITRPAGSAALGMRAYRPVSRRNPARSLAARHPHGGADLAYACGVRRLLA